MELVTASVQFSEYYDAVRQTSELIHSLQNASGLIEHAMIFFPRLGKSVSYDSIYNTIAPEEYHFLTEYQKRSGRSVFMSVEEQLYLVSDSMRFANKTNSAVLVVEFSRDAMAEWCALFPDSNAVSVLCNASPTDQLFRLWRGAVRPGAGSLPGGSDRPGQGAGRCRAPGGSPGQAGRRGLPAAFAPVGLREPVDRGLCANGQPAAGGANANDLAGDLHPFPGAGDSAVPVPHPPWMIAKPMARFAREVTQLKEEGVQLSPGERDGDMDFLYRSFVEVSDQLKQSMEQAYQSKLMAYQSEIKFIQAQVRPHFLYNSFYHLYRMAKMEDHQGVAEMSLRLSSYYRYITRSDENVVPLQMEYLNAADYVEIQKIRFGDRIQVELEPLPAEFQNLPVPRFVLQPLFENAYNHGVEKITGGRIVMRFVSTPETLTILVENNGACLQADLDALVAYLEDENMGEKVTALKNVKGRMKLLGGDLTVSRGSLGGFCATLVLRRERKEDTACKPS